ncbi:hypothetical protein BX285_3835 [Streptomyces sp. 1114.5]|uniref:hypothetical protein n=1 Tax=unclassified Streptomyces TaxID=2593676 RepID=UPI000BD741FD|nr:MULTISPECIES: hypothetical protein [unclassified Streptomyces]RKT19378.1 hypothetical protein BX285_3835 [Streptomyces sp. 1114.5]SOB85574.1 hypothetical protein SAMN06272789_5863 [Streptomyces sp. 1331.2]
MSKQGLKVSVQGDLPPKTMERIADAVRRTVLDEVAELDLAPPLREVAPNEVAPKPGPLGGPFLGIIFEPER